MAVHPVKSTDGLVIATQDLYVWREAPGLSNGYTLRYWRSNSGWAFAPLEASVYQPTYAVGVRFPPQEAPMAPKLGGEYIALADAMREFLAHMHNHGHVEARGSR